MQGIFPMGDPDTGAIDWFSPDPRGIIPLDRFHVPRNLARAVRQGKFSIRADTAFEDVMRACSKPRSPEDATWISEPLIEVYVSLQEAGHAHSVEAWLDDQLVGGLYGVHIGAAFFGESMFTLPARGGTNASKVCMVHLVRWLRHQNFKLLDTQFTNRHLHQFGCVEIPRAAYLALLGDAVSRPTQWGRFEPLQ